MSQDLGIIGRVVHYRNDSPDSRQQKGMILDKVLVYHSDTAITNYLVQHEDGTTNLVIPKLISRIEKHLIDILENKVNDRTYAAEPLLVKNWGYDTKAKSTFEIIKYRFVEYKVSLVINDNRPVFDASISTLDKTYQLLIGGTSIGDIEEAMKRAHHEAVNALLENRI